MSGNYIVSFMGFFPADKPDYVVYVAIDHPTGITQYGGTVSAPIAKKIIESIISLKDIKPSEEVIPREYTWLDTKYVKLEDSVGLSKKDAMKKLKGFNLEYSGNGDSVIYQEPEAGTYVKENSTIKLLLG